MVSLSHTVRRTTEKKAEAPAETPSGSLPPYDPLKAVGETTDVAVNHFCQRRVRRRLKSLICVCPHRFRPVGAKDGFLLQGLQEVLLWRQTG